MTTRQGKDWDPATSPAVTEIALTRVTRGRVRRLSPDTWRDGGSKLGQHLCVALNAHLQAGLIILVWDPQAPYAPYARITQAGQDRLAQVTAQNRNGRWTEDH